MITGMPAMPEQICPPAPTISLTLAANAADFSHARYLRPRASPADEEIAGADMPFSPASVTVAVSCRLRERQMQR